MVNGCFFLQMKRKASVRKKIWRQIDFCIDCQEFFLTKTVHPQSDCCSTNNKLGELCSLQDTSILNFKFENSQLYQVWKWRNLYLPNTCEQIINVTSVWEKNRHSKKQFILRNKTVIIQIRKTISRITK